MFTEELNLTENAIKDFSSLDRNKRIKRIHAENRFNKNHSIILSSFEDVKTLSTRLGKNIDAWVRQERKIQQMPGFKTTQSGRYPEEIQIEMKISDGLGGELKIDFKALYLFSKILLDQYVKFLHFINPADGIRSGTVEVFLHSLKNTCHSFYKDLAASMDNISANILNKLIFYRDKKIEHSQLLNEDVWFMNDMRGGIAISHINRDGGNNNVATIQPKELLNLLEKFFTTTSGYFIDNEDKIS
jgi:hypothetical protein